MKLIETSITIKDYGRIKKFKLDDRGCPVTINNKWSHGVDVKFFNSELVFLRKTYPISLSLEFKLEDEYADICCNGYQSLSSSFLSSIDSSFHEINPKILALFNQENYGDNIIKGFKATKKEIYSHFFVELINYGHSNLMISLNDQIGFTLFKYDKERKSIIIIKDLEGLSYTTNGVLNAIKIAVINCDTRLKCWDKAKMILNPDMKENRVSMWTSWHNYFTNISQDIIMENLNAININKIPLDIFQIDDGYQTAVGDWLDINEKFPDGLRFIADRIRECNITPGIWLAPFICEKKSNIYEYKKDWILKDEKGELVIAGKNPYWNSLFYALDIYNLEFREYLGEVFNTYINKFGFNLFKLDYLYAACLFPAKGKTRAGVMKDACDLIKSFTGNEGLIGCGCPLAPGIGTFDFMRTSGDISSYWEDKKLKTINYKKRISVYSSLKNTVARGFLNNRYFSNSSDVFMIDMDRRDKLNYFQKHTLLLTNYILGSIVSFSDNISIYSDSDINLIRSLFPLLKINIKTINLESKDVYSVKFNCDNREYICLINLSKNTVNINLNRGIYYNTKDKFILTKRYTLNPFESVCNLIVDINRKKPYAIASNGHIIPGNDIESITRDESNYIVKFKKDSNKYCRIFILDDDYPKKAKINGAKGKMSRFSHIEYISATINSTD